MRVHDCRSMTEIVPIVVLGWMLSFANTQGADAASRAPIILPGDRTSGQSENTLLLAKNGKSLQKIVLHQFANDDLKATAAYLAEKLEKITGARFEIAKGDGSSGIVLGTTSQFPVPGLQKPLEIRPVQELEFHNGAEAYGIRTEAKRLLLLGGREIGASHAATRFLELLGYRRFYPAPEWEIVPSLPALSFNRNETDRPFYLTRHFYGFRNSQEKAISEWARQNRLGESFTVNNGQQAYKNIVQGNKAEFEAHPEYTALMKGKRAPGTLCLSHPAVRAMAVKHALDYFAKNPSSDMCSMESSDGAAFCECDACKALGDASARVFGLANEVARAVRQKYPGKMIGMLAYFDHAVPPPFPMEANVHVQLAVRIYGQSGYTVRELIEMWSNKTWNLGDYDYVSLYFFGQDRLRTKAGAMPTANVELLRGDLALMARNGFLSFYSECGRNWGAHGRGNLVATALLWNPQTDVDALLADFYDKAFGPAAPAMKRYFDRVDGQNDYFSKTMLGLAFRDVDEAAHLAKDRPDVQSRLDHIKQFLYYNYLQHHATKDKNEKKDQALKDLIHQFRIRDSYITSWGMLKAYSLPSLAKTFAEPSWVEHGGKWKEISAWKLSVQKNKTGKAAPAPSIPPWMAPATAVPDPSLPGYEYVRPQDMYKPYTHEETEQLFQEGLAYFKPQELLQKIEYSSDLVPVNFPGTKSSPPSKQVLFSGNTVYLYSLSGEPIEFEIWEHPNGEKKYALKSPAGALVAEGSLPKGQEHHLLKLAVPAPGLYCLVTDGMRNHMAVSPGRVITVKLGAVDGCTEGGDGGKNFFYVPKGTRRLQLFWPGGDFKICDPSGTMSVIAVEKGIGDYITVPIPAGDDGKLWSYFGHWQADFVNAPNYIAPSPDALLVPRELAKKDGLTVVGGRK